MIGQSELNNFLNLLIMVDQYLSTNKLKLISVVVAVVEKDKKHLKKCLVSIEKSAKYAGIPIEIIVVANGTKAPSILYIHSPFKIIINDANLGFGQAINKGMSEATGQWCIILAPDTIIRMDTIQNLMKYVYIPRVAIITPKIHLSNNLLDYNLNPFPCLYNIFLEQSYIYKSDIPLIKLPNSDYREYEYTHEINASSSTFWLINKDIFLRLGRFDPRFFLFFDDTDLCKRIKDKGYRNIFVSEASITHLNHQSSGGIARGDLFIDGLKKYLLKYYPKYYTNISLFIFSLGCVFRIIFWNLRLLISNNRSIQKYGKSKITFCSQVLRRYISYISIKAC